jgi:hypothetical protein
VQQQIVYAGANSVSYQQASKHLRKLADLAVSARQVQRLTARIGAERVTERDAAVASYQALPLAQKHGSPNTVASPDVVAVMVDGGRLQIRDAEPEDEQPQGRPVEASAGAAAQPAERAGGTHWREDRAGLLLTLDSTVSVIDPCPHIPKHFVDPTRILKLARELKPVRVDAEAAGEAPASPQPETVEAPAYLPPEVVQRQVVASRQPWEEVGPMVAASARSQGFLGARRRAFIGDGAESNWTMQRRFFAGFVPILDFIHALSYVFAAALAGRKFALGWSIYVQWIGWLWQGQVEQVIAELAQRQAELGMPDQDEPETSPRQVVARALTYLQNHKDKMRYPAYRCQGLPLTSSHMESLMKQINQRLKGTEKFWCENGAEAILQLRADELSDDQPLDAFWQRRQDRETGQRPYRAAA